MPLVVGELIGLLKLDDEKFHSGLDKAGSAFGGMAKIAATAAAAAGVALIGVGVAATSMAISFEKDMKNVQSLLGAEATDKVKAYGQEVKNLAIDTGKDLSDMSDGLYQVISAWGDSEDAVAQLEISAKASAAGLATTTDAVNLLSAHTKGYGDTSAEAVQKAADLAFMTANLGQTTFPELAASMGAVIPLAATLKVQEEDLYGAMATLTGVTGNTAEVTTQLRATMQALLNPSKDMSTAISAAGYASGEAMIKSLGLQGTLDLLAKSTGGNTQELAQMFGSVEALGAVLALTGNQSKDFTEKTEAMRNATGAANAAFEIQQQSVDAMMKKVKQAATVLMVELGEKLLPVMQDLLNWILEHMPEIQGMFEKVFGVIVAGAELLGKGFKALTDNVLEPFFVGFETGTTGVETGFAKTVASLGASLTSAGGSFSKLQEEVLFPFFEGWENGNTDMWSSTQTAFAHIGSALGGLRDAFQKILEALMILWDLFGDDILSVAQTVWTAIAAVFDGAMKIINGILDVFIGLLTGDWSRMGEGIKQIWDGLWIAINAILEAGAALSKTILDSLFNAIKTIFMNLANGALQWGKDLMDGFWRGLKSKMQGILDGAKKFANDVAKTVKGALGIHSPSKVFAEIGANVGKGLALGIEGTERLVQRASDGLVPHVGVAGPSAGASGLLGGSQGAGGASGGPMIVQFVADGRTLASITARFLPGELLRVGVKI